MNISAIPFVASAPRTGFVRILKALKAYFMHAQTEHELKSLDAHMMRDIGLTPRARDEHLNLMFLTRGSW